MEFDSHKAFGHVRHLADEIGGRLVGSPAAERAAAYVAGQFAAAGLRVAEQEFSVHYAAVASHEIEVLEPPLGVIASSPVLLSADTPEDGLTGELLLVEGGDAAAIGPHLAGRIVLWMIASRADFQTRLEAVAAQRPRAIVVGWPAFGIEPKRQQLPEVTARRGMQVPVFCITFEQASALMAAAASRVRVRLQSARFKGRARNLIADVTGCQHPEEIVIVGAHYDTAPGIAGAIDNASGVAVVLELARLYARRAPARTLRFVAWAGEKAGMVGSFHYVAAHKFLTAAVKQGAFAGARGLDRHLLCISIDGVGVRLHHDVCYTSTEPDIVSALRETAARAGVPLKLADAYFGSDGEMFTQAGVPAISFGQEGPALAVLHTPADSVGMLDSDSLGRLGRLIDSFLQGTAERSGEWPFARGAPAAAQERALHWLREKRWLDLVPDPADLSIDYSS